ncbi:hypothetical protein K7432_003498 [Basidiobolus ranarum]|uniref:Uncharacterized protein n=1 Tax=Basidiobolus ranarum TaxID=34480 RepID=A0ABR2W697_9FUNG
MEHQHNTTTDIPTSRPLTKEQEALQTKEHITEIMQAAQEGSLPTTAQLTNVIEKIQEENSLHQAAEEMSPTGRRVMADTENLLDSTKKLLSEKNADDQLQNVIYHSKKSGIGASSVDEISHANNQLTGTVEEARTLLSEGADKITRVGWLIVTSPQLRRLMNDITSIFQEFVADNVPQHPESNKNVVTSVGSEYTGSFKIPQEQEVPVGEVGKRMQETLRQSETPLYESVKETARPYVEQAEDGNMPIKEAAEETLQEMKQGIQQRLQNVHLSSAQKDHLINRIKEVLRELQKNPEFQEVIDELINIVSTLKSHGMAIQSQVVETVQSKKEEGEDDLKIARSNAKELIEKFAENKSLDPLSNTIKELTEELSKDEELSSFTGDVREFLQRSVREYEFIDQPGYMEEARSLYDRGQNILDRKYRDYFQNISNEAADFIQALQHDRTTQAFTRDLENLTRDIFLDESGQPTIKYDLVRDFVKLVPTIAKKLEYCPLPRVENSDEQFNIILDNIVLKCSNITPDYISVKTDTVLDTKADSDQNIHNNVYIKFENIQVEAKNMAFYYKKKTFPKMSDVGYVDLVMPDDGISMDMKLNTTPAPDPVTSQSHAYQVQDVSTSVKDLKLKIHNSKHDILYKLLSPIINSKVKKVVQEHVSFKIREVMMRLDEQLTKIMENAKAQGNSSLLKDNDETSRLSKNPIPDWGSRAYDLKEPTAT